METAISSIQPTIIGSILYQPTSAIGLCLERGVTDAWFEDEHQTIYRVCLRRFSAGQAIDPVVVSDEVDGISVNYLLQCIDESGSVNQLAEYLDVLERQYLYREAGSAQENVQRILKGAHPDHIQADLDRIRGEWAKLGTGQKPQETLLELGTPMIDGWQDSEAEVGLDWPLDILNTRMPPLTDELIFLAAQESVGKTALILQWALQLAYKDTISSISSLESNRKRLLPRMIANHCQLDMMPLRKREASESEYTEARKGLAEINALPIRISDNGMNMERLAAWGQMEKAAGSRLLMRCNMRHIRPSQVYRSTVEQFRDLSVKLKWLRDDTGLPVLVLHHLSYDKKTPDVSWSKDIRRDADIILFMADNADHSVPPTIQNQYQGKWIVDLYVSKCRDGVRGFQVQTEFIKKHQRFIEWKAPVQERARTQNGG